MLQFLTLLIFCSPSYGHPISLEKFEELGQEISEVYAPMAIREGTRLNLEWLPERPTPINAVGMKIDDSWSIKVYGGLMFHPKMNLETLRFILCHEVGHIIGGEPKFGDHTNSGQPDYYAAAVCMKLLLVSKDNSLFGPYDVDATLNQKCISKFKDQKSQNLCRRIGNAGLGLSQFLLSFYPGSAASYATPSHTIASEITQGHPDPQCRLDTILAGTLCNAKPLGINSQEADEINNACDVEGSRRPNCWFVP